MGVRGRPPLVKNELSGAKAREQAYIAENNALAKICEHRFNEMLRMKTIIEYLERRLEYITVRSNKGSA
jgi:hypothetical protein